MSTMKKFPWWVIILIVGGICALCVGFMAVVGYFYSNSRKTSQPDDIAIVETMIPVATVQPIQTTIPILPEATSTSTPETIPYGIYLTGDQQFSDKYLYDDFSSNSLGWLIYDDGKTILQLENGQYSFQVTEAGMYDHSATPNNFPATEIWFDVQGLSGTQNGTFGVFCQRWYDEYYFIEFDLEFRMYVIGEVVGGEYIYFTPEDADGNLWVVTDAINSDPSAVNRIGITCTLDFISLYINDEWMTDVSVTTPFEINGELSLFVYAFDFADENGYKVFFDNVEVISNVID